MKIVTTAIEIAPFLSGGGMAELSSNLCYEWSKLENEITIVLPAHTIIDKEKFNIQKTDISFKVPISFDEEDATIYKSKLPNSEVNVYFISHDTYFHEYYQYGKKNLSQEEDRALIFFCKAFFMLLEKLNYSPDIIQTHDYHFAFIQAYLKTKYKNHSLFENSLGVHTIHNLGFQGEYDIYRIMDFSDFPMKEFNVGSWFEHEGKVNFMKTGIMFADKITTVSPKYAEEIRMPYYSEGLLDVINSRSSDLIGILNGISYQKWDCKNDKFLYKNYSEIDLDNKVINKKSYLEEFAPKFKNKELPLFAINSRITKQKGFDIFKGKFERFLHEKKFNLFILGVGEKEYEDYLKDLSLFNYENVYWDNIYNENKSHKLIAAADFILLPSLYEPCGLVQMYALKYGTIPIVRATGGLAETIDNFNLDKATGNGITFDEFSGSAFCNAIEKALMIYNDYELLNKLRLNGMNSDFSAKRCAKDYLTEFRDALNEKL